MLLTVNDQQYRVEFHHKTRLGLRAGLRHAPVKAITTCVLVRGNLVAIENALCSERDNFSRREGRIHAFDKLLRYCGALRDVAPDLWVAYLKIDPPPVPKPRAEKLSEQVRERLREQGQDHKVERRLERKLTRRRAKLDKLMGAGAGKVAIT